MRTHGWSGNAPADDEEAVARILQAARRALDERGTGVRINDVARDLGVTRQTVYRYFPTVESLLLATALEEAGPYLDRLTAHLAPITDPAEAVVEGIAYTLESLPRERYLGLLMTPGQAGTRSASVTSDTALSFGRILLDRMNVEWSSVGIEGERRDTLVEFMLRILQSFVVDPGRPPRTGAELRAFLGEWLRPAITHHLND